MVTVMSYIEKTVIKNASSWTKPQRCKDDNSYIFVFKMSKVENDQIEDTCSLIWIWIFLNLSLISTRVPQNYEFLYTLCIGK